MHGARQALQFNSELGALGIDGAGAIGSFDIPPHNWLHSRCRLEVIC